MRWTNIIIVFSVISFLFAACGDKFNAPKPDIDSGGTTSVDDTTYIQLRPEWNRDGGYGFSNPQDILVGRETLVYVADTGNNRIAMLDLAGNVLGYSARVDSPVAIAQDQQLRLLIVTGRNYLFRIDLYEYGHNIEAATIDTIHHAVDRPGWHFNGVDAFTISEYDYYLVTCSGSSRNDNQILVFLEDGSLQGPLPLTPGGTGLFAAADPAGITALRDGSVDFIYSQRGENFYKVQIITSDAFGWKPKLDPTSGGDLFTVGKFSSPENIALDGDGFIFVVDSEEHRVFKFAGTGKEYESFGEEGSGEVQFKNPHGVAEFDGTVFVADTGNDRIVRFRLSTDTK